jgi:hypothetical protein
MLRDKVEDFIANRANPTELHELLSECMDDGSVEGLACVRRLYQDMYGGITYNFELKAAAASCLLFWGEAGLQALIDGENALTGVGHFPVGRAEETLRRLEQPLRRRDVEREQPRQRQIDRDHLVERDRIVGRLQLA